MASASLKTVLRAPSCTESNCAVQVDISIDLDFGAWVTPWPAEEMHNRQRQRVDVLSTPELFTMASRRKDWKRMSAKLSHVSP